ncbi:MAG: glycosyl hydrolase family 18 protein [Verrucomicrobiota bacterium]
MKTMKKNLGIWTALIALTMSSLHAALLTETFDTLTSGSSLFGQNGWVKVSTAGTAAVIQNTSSWSPVNRLSLFGGVAVRKTFTETSLTSNMKFDFYFKKGDPIVGHNLQVSLLNSAGKAFYLNLRGTGTSIDIGLTDKSGGTTTYTYSAPLERMTWYRFGAIMDSANKQLYFAITPAQGGKNAILTGSLALTATALSGLELSGSASTASGDWFVDSLSLAPLKETVLSKKGIVYLCQEFNTESISEDVVANSAKVDVLAPTWFTVSDSSELMTVDIDYSNYKQFCRNNQIALVPNVKQIHASNMLLNTTLLTQVAQEIVNVVQSNNFDGITIDLEDDGTNSAALTSGMQQFLSIIKSNFDASNKILCVTFNPAYWGKSWRTATLSSYCDLAFGMFYDYSGPWKPSYANSSAPYIASTARRDVKRDLDKVIAGFPAKNQLIFALPVYSNDCSYNSLGQSVLIENQYSNYLLKIKKQYNATQMWDSEAQTPYFIYVDGSGVQHKAWYENADSYAWRMQIPQTNGFAGMGVWSVGSPDGIDPDFWPSVQKYRTLYGY